MDVTRGTTVTDMLRDSRDTSSIVSKLSDQELCTLLHWAGIYSSHLSSRETQNKLDAIDCDVQRRESKRLRAKELREKIMRETELMNRSLAYVEGAA